MPIDSNRLEAFYSVAKFSNFSKAAESLGLTQSALSQRVAKLEDELSTNLVIRDSAGIRLTSSGQELLRYCHAQKSLEEELLSNIDLENRNSNQGVIRIAGYSSVVRSIFMPLLADYIRDNPKIQIEFFTREIKELPKLLFNGEVDFLILNSKIEKIELESHVLAQEENVLIMPSNYTIQDDIYLDHDIDDQTTLNFLKQQTSKKIIEIKRNFLDDVYGIIDGVRLGYGKAVVSKHLIKREKDIKIVSTKKRVFSPIILHYYARSYYPKIHSDIVDILVNKTSTLISN